MSPFQTDSLPSLSPRPQGKIHLKQIPVEIYIIINETGSEESVYITRRAYQGPNVVKENHGYPPVEGIFELRSKRYKMYKSKEGQIGVLLLPIIR